jgi:hypothetical protein
MNKPVSLTKSLFKKGLECPVKLRYDNNPCCGNSQDDNEFLQAFAESRFQVGKLAKLMFTGGVEIKEISHSAALVKTTEQLAQDDVTIFEAALTAEVMPTQYFVRVDVLRKNGNNVDIIEVKSKRYDPYDEGFFKTSQSFASKTLPYLLNVTFQTYVARLALPRMNIRSTCALFKSGLFASKFLFHSS